MKTSKLFPTLAVLIFVALCVAFVAHGKLTLEIALAEAQVQIFDHMRTQALAGSPHEGAGCLGYVLSYYPSGARLATGSRLDRMVELARAATTREILAHLRRTTGKDLGDDPAKWIAAEDHNSTPAGPEDASPHPSTAR